MTVTEQHPEFLKGSRLRWGLLGSPKIISPPVHYFSSFLRSTIHAFSALYTALSIDSSRPQSNASHYPFPPPHPLSHIFINVSRSPLPVRNLLPLHGCQISAFNFQRLLLPRGIPLEINQLSERIEFDPNLIMGFIMSATNKAKMYSDSGAEQFDPTSNCKKLNDEDKAGKKRISPTVQFLSTIFKLYRNISLQNS